MNHFLPFFFFLKNVFFFSTIKKSIKHNQQHAFRIVTNAIFAFLDAIFAFLDAIFALVARMKAGAAHVLILKRTI